MFKKIVMIMFLGLVSLLSANINIAVSIAPIKTYLQEIAKDKVDITLLINKGDSAHSYTVKPSQMKQISKSDMYFAIGVEFEDVWLSKFEQINKNMKIIHLDKSIAKLDMKHHSHKEHHNNDKHKESLDPHIWTNPDNIKIISKNILNALIINDNTNKSFYENNYNNFIKQINSIDDKIKQILKNTPLNSKFLVFHPSWQYFALKYNLVQMPIEIEGKNPKPKALQKIITNAKNNNIKAIIVSPAQSYKIAQIIAKQLNIKLVEVYPLSYEWDITLIKLANAIAK